MKIGIYGDSFACPFSCRHRSLYPHPPESKPWMQILQEKYQQDITNFAVSGSGIYFSYKNFLENYKQFDKNIFIATNPARLYAPFTSRIHWQINLNGTENMDGYTAVKLYFEELYNHDEHIAYRNLIIDKLSSIPNTLVIDNNNDFDLDNLWVICMNEFSYLQSKTRKQLEWENENRYCHMSSIANEYVAGKFNEWIETGQFKLDAKNCPLPSEHETKIYWPNCNKDL